MRPIRLFILAARHRPHPGARAGAPAPGTGNPRGEEARSPCGGSRPEARAEAPFTVAQGAAPTFGYRIVSYARHFIGIPYSYGGSSPGTGFDCSGLVRFVYGHFGIRLPHSSWADLSHGRRISRRSLRPGDLVFFYGAGHVGIYVGRGRFIDAPHSGARVRVSAMGQYSGYYGARRFGASLALSASSRPWP